MKMMRKIFTLLLVLALCLAMSVSVFAFDECDSPTVTVSVGGKSYDIWSTLFRDGSRYRSGTWIQTTDNSNIPAGGVQVQTFLMSGNGQIAQSALSTIPNATYFHVAFTPYTSTSASGIYGTGTAYIKLSDGSYKSYSSANANESNLNSLALVSEDGQLMSDGSYPQNSEGMTYGSLALADVVGTEPELISAIGTQGESGYVRCDELFANYDTEGYAGRYIGLYDVNGNDIGSFFITFNDTSEFVGKDIDEVRALLADGRAENPELWELADKALVDGEYPVNANGETYGNYSLRELVGYAPDLVLAVNEDGVQGYVRNTDTPVMALSENGESSAAISLYDKDGNVIGTFGNININEAQTAGKDISEVASELK